MRNREHRGSNGSGVADLAGPATLGVGKRSLVEQTFGPVPPPAQHTGERAPIQAKLTPHGEELARAWQAQVLHEATLDHSTERRVHAQPIAALQLGPSDPAEGDRQLLALLAAYAPPQADPHAIFDDVVPGQLAVARIIAAHRRLVTELDRHVHRELDDYVEQQIIRADKTRRGGGGSAEAIAAVRSGTFTSVKDNHGDLSPSVNTEGRAQVLERAEQFNEFTQGAEPPPQALAARGVLLYRRVKSQHLQGLTAGATIEELLPFSASWSRAFAENWSPGQGVIFELDVPVGYPMLFQARRPGAEPRTEVVPLNQSQGEVTLVQSRLTLVTAPREVTDGQGRRNFVARATATPLSLEPAVGQHNAMKVMTDEHRRAVAAQQREDDPVEPDDRQREIAAGLTGLEARVATLIAAVPRAAPEQTAAVGKRLAQFAATHKPALGPALSVLRGFEAVATGDRAALAMLLRRLYDPQYYAGCALGAGSVVGMLGALLETIEKLLAPQTKQMKLACGGGPATGGGAPATASGGGQPLPADLRGTMEGLFGSEFGDVRVHQGGHVTELGAHAYTQGTDLHFAPGQYAPETPAGRELIGHELAHVVQQRSGRVATRDGAINMDPQLEAEADAAGARAARGEVSGLAATGGGARAAGPVQRKVIATNDPDRRAAAMIDQHSARTDLLARIRKSDDFHLIYMAGETLPGLGGVAGVTIATLLAGKDKIARLRDSETARSLDVNTLKRVTGMEVEVIGFTTEKLFTGEDIVPASQPGQDIAIIHEIERHALPFFELFERIQHGRFESEVKGKDDHLTATRDALASGELGNADVQHKDPALAAHTARTTLSLADQVGGASAAELVFRLYVDTIARGVAMTDLTEHYAKSGGQRTAAWNAFEALVTKLAGAVLGEQVTGPLVGRRVIVIDGVYRGLEGAVAPEQIPQGFKSSHDEILVMLDNGQMTAVRTRRCWFLRQ